MLKKKDRCAGTTAKTDTKQCVLHRRATHNILQKTFFFYNNNNNKFIPKSSKKCARRPSKNASEKHQQKLLGKISKKGYASSVPLQKHDLNNYIK